MIVYIHISPVLASVNIGREDYIFRKGAISWYYMLYCRRVESKKCADTGIGLKERCCKIKSPIRLPHGLAGIVIARNVLIGENVTIFQHVTIAESDKNRITVIEDNVMIGAGAVRLNNVHIGKDAKIGANAVVLKDIPAGCTAVGNPARIVKKY